MPDRKRRHLRTARNPWQCIEAEKVVCLPPARIVELVDDMRSDLDDRYQRVDAA